MPPDLTSPGAPAVAVILGSAFSEGGLPGIALEPVVVPTRLGAVTLHRAALAPGARPAYALFRHGLPHRALPHRIPYRAHALALREAGVGALLVTSSVGVLDPAVPLNTPLLVSDLLMPDNRLPDGAACTVFDGDEPGEGHLVLDEGLFSRDLAGQLRQIARAEGVAIAEGEVVFAYVGGPRTKTRAENAFWRAAGAHVNSMTVGPEVVLANELGIPCAALVVGHKHSSPDAPQPADAAAVAASLDASRAATARLVAAFLQEGSPVPFRNHLFRFSA